PERGLDAFAKAFDLAEELGDRTGQVQALRARSDLFLRGGDARAAEGELRRAGQLLDGAGELTGSAAVEQSARVQLELGSVLVARERFGPAQAAYQRSLDIARDSAVDLRGTVAAAHAGLAELALQEGELGTAREHQEAALALRRELGAPLEVARVRLALASLDLAAGKAEAAAETAAELESVFLEASDSPGLLAARVLRARALTGLGETLEARREVSAAASMLGTGTPPELGLAVSLADARLVAAEGDPRRAVRILQQQLAESVTTERMGPSLELRLALGELELAGDLEAAGRSRLRSVREDAAAAGYLWIARRAEAALK
ncbi:MAG: tetratricopeptide repeat protein, partial [Acidobacteria bacterium]|nr:tetratricopeptide repeat protein [Acidobacteriota bacterium]